MKLSRRTMLAASLALPASAAPGEGPDVFTVVMDYNSVDKYERLGSDLQKRGSTSAQVEKLFGANLLRVYREVWG